MVHCFIGIPREKTRWTSMFQRGAPPQVRCDGTVELLRWPGIGIFQPACEIPRSKVPCSINRDWTSKMLGSMGTCMGYTWDIHGIYEIPNILMFGSGSNWCANHPQDVHIHVGPFQGCLISGGWDYKLFWIRNKFIFHWWWIRFERRNRVGRFKSHCKLFTIYVYIYIYIYM